MSEKLCQTRPFSRKGGRYDKNNRDQRRAEVFKLHFELGYPARRISEMLEINRNTINDDISHLYGKLETENKGINYETWLSKQWHRFESQRTRLLESLDKQDNTQDKISIEKMIFEIDKEMVSLKLKVATSITKTLEYSCKFANAILEKTEKDERVIPSPLLQTVNIETYEKINKILSGED